MALTKAEMRVLQLLPTHLSLGEIGEELHTSRNTVKTHVAAIYRKLQCSTRTEAVDRGRDLGLLPVTAPNRGTACCSRLVMRPVSSFEWRGTLVRRYPQLCPGHGRAPVSHSPGVRCAPSTCPTVNRRGMSVPRSGHASSVVDCAAPWPGVSGVRDPFPSGG